MIDYLSGQLTEITPTSAIVECGGIGYEVNISLIDFTSIQNEKNVKLYLHEAIR